MMCRPVKPETSGGPPEVSMNTTENSRRAPTKPATHITRSMPRASGRSSAALTCALFAPSSRAASRAETGTRARAPATIIAVMGTDSQRLTPRVESTAAAGSVSRLILIPVSRASSEAPPSPCRNARQTGTAM